MPRSRPRIQCRRAQSVELDLCELTRLELESYCCATIPIRGKGIELAGAAVGAVAVGQLLSFDVPFDHDLFLYDFSRTRPIMTIPAQRATRAPDGKSFSASTRAASAAAQSKFITPKTNNSAISAQ